MRTDWTPTDLARSVIAVPPLARTLDMALAPQPNAALMARMRAGGITTFLYGGNANLYNVASSEVPELLDLIEEAAPDDAWIIPSAGPDRGKLMDAAAVLRTRRFPLVMVLPGAFPSKPSGTERMVQDFADALGAGVMLYLKTEMVAPDAVGRLHRSGAVAAVKYAIPREVGAADPYLHALAGEIPAERIVSGFGEQPAVNHLRRFGLAGFTAGSVCIAPVLSTRVLDACKRGDWATADQMRGELAPFEQFRDFIDPIGVLHAAIGWAGLEDMGPILPPAAIPSDEHRAAITAAARDLLDRERATAPSNQMHQQVTVAG